MKTLGIDRFDLNMTTVRPTEPQNRQECRARMSDEATDDRQEVHASRVDWNLMRTFVDIVRAGGISAAARQLNRQQPSISAALKRFEEQVGTTAAAPHRDRRPKVTAAGEGYPGAVRGHAGVGAADAAPGAQATKRVEGIVRIQIVSGLVSHRVRRSDRQFHRRHTRQFTSRFRVSPWRRVADALERGEVEIGVGYDSSVRGSLMRRAAARWSGSSSTIRAATPISAIACEAGSTELKERRVRADR